MEHIDYIQQKYKYEMRACYTMEIDPTLIHTRGQFGLITPMLVLQNGNMKDRPEYTEWPFRYPWNTNMISLEICRYLVNTTSILMLSSNAFIAITGCEP